MFIAFLFLRSNIFYERGKKTYFSSKKGFFLAYSGVKYGFMDLKKFLLNGLYLGFLLGLVSPGLGSSEDICPVHKVKMEYVSLPYTRTGELDREQVEGLKVRGVLFL